MAAGGMTTVLIDKLLTTVLQLKASDLHIASGQPPVIRHNGRMRRLDTKTLDSDDTTALMKSITPDRCQQELQEKGGSDFAISFGDSRFRVAIFKQKGVIGMVLRRIPSKFMTFDEIGMPGQLTNRIKQIETDLDMAQVVVTACGLRVAMVQVLVDRPRIGGLFRA